MIYLRFQTHTDEPPTYGWMEDGRIGSVNETPFDEHVRGALRHDLDDVQLAAPAQPGKVICASGNYESRLAETGATATDLPWFVLKPPSAVIGPGDAILLPPQSRQVEHAAELGIVIGRRARWVSVEDAFHFVLGYTCANDVTARDLTQADGHSARGKSFDTFLPLGPWLTGDVDPSDLVIVCNVNGQVRQMASTRELRFSAPQLVAFFSSVMTLEPGDVILTGTPGGVGTLSPGDVVEIEIEGIGSLRNSVAEAV